MNNEFMISKDPNYFNEIFSIMINCDEIMRWMKNGVSIIIACYSNSRHSHCYNYCSYENDFKFIGHYRNYHDDLIKFGYKCIEVIPKGEITHIKGDKLFIYLKNIDENCKITFHDFGPDYYIYIKNKNGKILYSRNLYSNYFQKMFGTSEIKLLGSIDYAIFSYILNNNRMKNFKKFMNKFYNLRFCTQYYDTKALTRVDLNSFIEESGINEK